MWFGPSEKKRKLRAARARLFAYKAVTFAHHYTRTLIEQNTEFSEIGTDGRDLLRRATVTAYVYQAGEFVERHESKYDPFMNEVATVLSKTIPNYNLHVEFGPLVEHIEQKRFDSATEFWIAQKALAALLGEEQGKKAYDKEWGGVAAGDDGDGHIVKASEKYARLVREIQSGGLPAVWNMSLPALEEINRVVAKQVQKPGVDIFETVAKTIENPLEFLGRG